MKKEIADKWTAALRSGEYKQGRSQLRSLDNKFCCLGVLCEIAVQEGIIAEAVKSSSANHKVYYYRYDYGSLPYEVQQWAGMSSSYGKYVNSRNQEITLTDLNDEKEMSFKQIANIIEKVYDKL